ncbi:hypothetical protein GWI33_014998 [Rhynchophorus ferrugineus]|uniref:Uncharacterized protein n=1 Tax=Rhynchophorus ferrugineus TaxID=354439 RepID=A0A834I698_RHYFE|nr:hypothetical protein GWI33_014998 [Rhynchophorus ferrugineus]
MDKKEFCVLIKYCFLKGKNTVDTAPGKSTIKDWDRIAADAKYANKTTKAEKIKEIRFMGFSKNSSLPGQRKRIV